MKAIVFDEDLRKTRLALDRFWEKYILDSAASSAKTFATSAPTAVSTASTTTGEMPEQGGTRYFSPRQIRRVAKLNGPKGQVLTTYIKQGWVETRLRLRGGGFFRSNQNEQAIKGYASMAPDEFKIINSVQSWANWRTIPRNLTGRLPAKPVRVLDLCSGTGDSTSVLASYAAQNSHITGIEVDPRFVKVAQSRHYKTFDGQPQQVDFSAQDVLEPFCDGLGHRLEPHSVDLINVSGAVAVHFDAQSTARLAGQCALIIRPQGLALVDAGYEGASPRIVRTCFESRGFTLIHEARSCALDLSRQLCFRRDV